MSDKKTGQERRPTPPNKPPGGDAKRPSDSDSRGKKHTDNIRPPKTGK